MRYRVGMRLTDPKNSDWVYVEPLANDYGSAR